MWTTLWACRSNSRKGVLLTMARKSKHMALNEAIRQGQAKMAEGPSVQKPKEDAMCPKSIIQSPVKCRAVFLKSKEKFANSGWFSPKMRLIVLLCIALVLVIWLVSLLSTDQSSQRGNSAPRGSLANAVGSEENKQDMLQEKQAKKEFSLFGLGKRDSSESTDEAVPEAELQLPVLSKGVNVIWIQSIVMSRKGELDSLETFFRTKGIQTEIIEISESNLAVLVTRDGFEDNPSTKGTEGNKLLERIKQLGTVYVEETKDTKFKLKPFQDAYGYKR